MSHPSKHVKPSRLVFIALILLLGLFGQSKTKPETQEIQDFSPSQDPISKISLQANRSISTDTSSKAALSDSKNETKNDTKKVDPKLAPYKNGLKWGFLRHEYVETIIWVGFVDLVAFMARHFKSVYQWRYIHLIVMAACMYMTYFVRQTGQRGIKPSDPQGYKDAHEFRFYHLKTQRYLIYIGLYGMTPAGVLLLLVRYFSWWTRTMAKVGVYIHIIGGIVTWTLARVCCFAGGILYGYKFDSWWLLIIMVLETTGFLGYLGYLEYKKRKELSLTDDPEETDPVLHDNSQTMNPLEDGSSKSQTQLITSRIPNNIYEDLKEGCSKRELLELHPKSYILFVHNSIVDLTKFNHPGGKRLIEPSRWEDAGRYLLGMSAVELSLSSRAVHSDHAWKLVKKYEIGSLKPILDLQGPMSIFKAKFRRTSKKDYCSETSFLKFQKSFSPEIKVPILVKGTNFVGRHYSVKRPSDGKTRYYTHCASICDEHKTYIDKLFDRVKKSYQLTLSEEESEKISSDIIDCPTHIDYLPLIIKKYPGKQGLANFIHRMDAEEEVEIEGPMGYGFKIEKNRVGKVLIVAGGTGILPFIDLFYIIVKKLLYYACKAKGINTDNVKPKQNYEDLFEGTTFLLYCSFNKFEEFVGQRVLEQIVELQEKTGLKVLDVMARIKKIPTGSQGQTSIPLTSKRFSRDVFGETDFSQILICGPEGFGSTIFKNLNSGNEKIDKNIVTMV